MDMVHPTTKAQKHNDACQMHWIKCIDLYILFLELLPALHNTLQDIVILRQYEELSTN